MRGVADGRVPWNAYGPRDGNGPATIREMCFLCSGELPMAGQPRTRLRRIERIEAELVEFLKRIDREIPDWARKQPTPKYPGAKEWASLRDAGFVLGFRLLQVGDLLALSALPPGRRHEPDLVEFLAQWSNGRKIRDTRLGVPREAEDDDHDDEDTESEDLDRDPEELHATDGSADQAGDSGMRHDKRNDVETLVGVAASEGADVSGNTLAQMPVGV
jgi:hypothetical protein